MNVYRAFFLVCASLDRFQHLARPLCTRVCYVTALAAASLDHYDCITVMLLARTFAGSEIMFSILVKF